jgi:hypothetical protein
MVLYELWALVILIAFYIYPWEYVVITLSFISFMILID